MLSTLSPSVYAMTILPNDGGVGILHPMRRLSFLTLTDTKKKQGDFVRMDNLLRHLGGRRPIRVIGLPRYNEESAKRLGKYPYFLVKEIARMVLAIRALFLPTQDIVYTWDWLLARNLAMLSTFRRMDFVMEVNGLHSFEAEIRGYFKQNSFWNRQYISRGERLVCRKAKMIVTVSEGFRQTIHKRYDIPLDKIVVAHNGTDTERFSFSPKSWDREGPFTIGWVGTFQPYEGFETFIDLSRVFRERGEAVRFLIVGDGSARAGYEEHIQSEGLEEFFAFRGKVDWKEVPKVLGESHCCILVPTLTDAGMAYRDAIGMTQMKFYEYLALGKPVVTYNLGDAEELIAENGAGLTSEPTLEALARAILDLREKDLIGMSRAARALAEERFTWEKTAETIHLGLEERFPE